MKRIKMSTPNGQAEIEVGEDQVAALEAKGYRVIPDPPVKPVKTTGKKSESYPTE